MASSRRPLPFILETNGCLQDLLNKFYTKHYFSIFSFETFTAAVFNFLKGTYINYQAASVIIYVDFYILNEGNVKHFINKLYFFFNLRRLATFCLSQVV